MTNDEISSLHDLIEVLEDARDSFMRTADRLEAAGEDEIADLMRERADQRGLFARELRVLARSRGAEFRNPSSPPVSDDFELLDDRALERFWDAIDTGKLGRDAMALVGKQAFALKRADDELRSWRLRRAA